MINTEHNVMETDKENKTLLPAPDIVGKVAELHEQNRKHEVETLFSPPKKKLKQDNIQFTKVLPEDLAEKDVRKTSHRKEIHDNEKVAGVSKTPVSNGDKMKKGSPPVTKAERSKLKELKEQQKLLKQQEIEEKKLIRQAEKEKREQEKQEKIKLKEEDKKRKEEEKRLKEEQKELEKRKKEELKEIEQRKRDAEREKKEAERKQKEEQKRLEEEKKKMEEEAARRKKEKAANQFKSFFKKTSVTVKKEEVAEYERFKPFQIKPNMLLAPICRRHLKSKEELDECLLDSEQSDCLTYLKELSVKHTSKKPFITRRQFRREYEKQRKSELQEKKKVKEHNSIVADVVVIDASNEPTDGDDEDEDDDIEISFNDQILVQTKLLQFSENTRPAYYGTWRKTTKKISGRKPFGRDLEIFNYDIESDEEWIDEPGEDCSDNNDDDDDEEEKETDDDDDGFFVPHGYLSDDEGVKDSDDDDDGENGDNDNVLKDNNQNREDEKLKSKVCSFEVKFNKKLKPRKPICFGINYDVTNLPKYLQDFIAVELFETLLDEEEEIDFGCPKATEQKYETSPFPDQPPIGYNIPQTVPDEAMEFLIRMVHGNTASVNKMITCFRDFWCEYVKANSLSCRSFISKRQLERKIQSIATRGHNSEISKICYTVKNEILHKYNLKELSLGSGLPLKSKQCDVSMETETLDISNNNVKDTEMEDTTNQT